MGRRGSEEERRGEKKEEMLICADLGELIV